MNPLEIFDSISDQYNYYFDVKIPDLTSIKDINKVVFCGMGGSAFPADIVVDHIKESYKKDIIIINRDYILPFWVDENTLVIVASFSGSTEETLSCMKEAMERKLPLIGMSMGGEISRLCSEQKIPYISLPKVIMPRFGSGYLASALMRVLVELKLIAKQDEEIRNIKILIDPLKVNIQKSAESLSKKIKERIVNVYTDTTSASSGNIARICMNETGKTVSYASTYSESNHNELASYTYTPYPHAMLLLTYPHINKRILDRFDLMPQLMENVNVVFEKINCNFERILYREIYFSMYFSFLSYFTAKESEFDPIGVPTQEHLKVLLKTIK